MTMHNPAHPALAIRDILIPDNNLTITQTAAAMNISRENLSRLINGHVNITPDMALRIAHVFGGTPDIWMRTQLAYDLWHAQQKFSAKGLSILHTDMQIPA